MSIARAVFAACPSSPVGCSSMERISFTAGENISFNASIIHISGGSCGFKQKIQRVELRLCINNTCTTQSPLLSFVNVDRATYYNSDVRVSLSEERDLAYVFSLSNATPDDSGLYQVTVMGIHPSSGDSTTIGREYLVIINGENYSKLSLGHYINCGFPLEQQMATLQLQMLINRTQQQLPWTLSCQLMVRLQDMVN